MIRLVSSAQSNSMPATRLFLVTAEAKVAIGSIVKAVDGGTVSPIATAGDTEIVGLVVGIKEATDGGFLPPETDGLGNSFQDKQEYTAPAANSTIYAEVVVDPDAEYEADWNVTPTANSLEAFAQTDIAPGGKTLVNANSVAVGSGANVVILHSDATTKKAIVRLNRAESAWQSDAVT